MMRKEYNELIQLEQEYEQFSKAQFKNEDNSVTRENVKEILRSRSENLQEVGRKASAILNDFIYPYIKDPNLINPELARELEEFAEKLSGYSDRIDTGLSCDIRDALVKYAKIINDDELYIRNLFHKGVCLLFLSKALFHEEMLSCYTEIISFASKYETFSKDTRNLIVRAFGNCYVSVKQGDIYTFFEYIDKAKNFWENTGKKIDPDFRWEAFYANIDENICSTGITYLRSCCDEGKEFDKELIERVYQSSQKIYTEKTSKEKTPYSFTMERTKYVYFAGKYYKGEMSREDFCEELYKIYISANHEKYAPNDTFMNLQISALYLYYLAKVDNLNLYETDKIDRVKEIEKNVLDYAKNLPIEFPQQQVTGLLSNFATGIHTMYDSFEFLRIVLAITIFRHKPTYTHSIVTAKIAATIIKYIIKDNPESLIGINGINSLADVKKYADKITELTWFSALSHDVGKIAYTDMVAIYVRKLNDLEFEIIKQHPHSQITKDYERKLKESADSKEHVDEILLFDDEQNTKFGFINNQQAMEAIVKVAYGHHKSYDEKFGYPKDCDNSKSKVKQIIDIVTVADCIDAATDTVGRSYAKGKSLEELVQELKSGSGTRYSPGVVEIIENNKDLYKEIEKIITSFRYDVYFDCFNEEKVSSSMYLQY